MEERSNLCPRRRFLSKVLAAAAALAARPALARPPEPEQQRLSRLLAKYGGELGDLRRIAGRD